MLTRRTNVLLSEEDFYLLRTLAQKEKTTMGDLIRKAVQKVYTEAKNTEKKQLAYDIKQLAKRVNTKGIDYVALVSEGRK